MATDTKPERKPRRTQRERSETTTRQLVATARALFARHGYAAASLEAVVSECGVTKGALYHHFTGKEQLFEAVFIDEQEHIARRIRDAYRTRKDPIDAFYAGGRAFLEVSLDPEVQQITLLDAPAVLGWQRMRVIESNYGLAMMKNAIHAALSAKRMQGHDVDSLAHLLFGALCEGAMYMARAENQPNARRKVEREFKSILDALQT